MKVECFSGVMDSVGPVQFLRDIEAIKAAYRISDAKFLELWIPAYLKRDALWWFVNHRSF